MEKGKYNVKVFEVTIHEMEDEASFGKLELYGWGLEHGSEPLETQVSGALERIWTKTMDTSGGSQNSILQARNGSCLYPFSANT